MQWSDSSYFHLPDHLVVQRLQPIIDIIAVTESPNQDTDYHWAPQLAEDNNWYRCESGSVFLFWVAISVASISRCGIKGFGGLLSDLWIWFWFHITNAPLSRVLKPVMLWRVYFQNRFSVFINITTCLWVTTYTYVLIMACLFKGLKHMFLCKMH